MTVFEAGSELLHLPDCDSYVWQRRTADGSPEEVAIIAGSDVAALREVLVIMLCDLLDFHRDDEISSMLINTLVDRKIANFRRYQHGQA